MTDPRHNDSRSVDPRPGQPPIRIEMGQLKLVPPGRSVSILVGSCVGLFLFERHTRTVCASHILLPAGRLSRERVASNSPGRFADTAVDTSLTLIAEHCRRVDRSVTAYCIGGADMFETNSPSAVGGKNVDAVLFQLARREIAIAQSDLGGNRARRGVFDPATASLAIRYFEALPGTDVPGHDPPPQ